jgi:hypothetical protein
MKKVCIYIVSDSMGGYRATVKAGKNPSGIHTTLRYASADNAEHAAKVWIGDNLGSPKIEKTYV